MAFAHKEAPKEMNDAKLIEFTHIPPEAGVWRQVLDLGTRLRFRKGEEIMHGGEKGEYLYYVHQGEARLMRTTLDGREKILMSMRSGTVTGETPFFDEVPARSSIVAGTDCVVYAFSRDCVLHEILPNYPALTLALLHSLASKVRVLCNQSVSLSLEELPPRICRFLHLRMRDDGGAPNPRVSPGLNQQELANLLGVHRVTLNKALRELEREAVLGPYSRDEVYIVDMERFHELSLK